MLLPPHGDIACDAEHMTSLRALNDAEVEWITGLVRSLDDIGVGDTVGELRSPVGGATDEYGTEAAVCGDPGAVLLYPMNAVAKR